ncbi:MAG: twin-arginine translocation signal domain-containing protein, partial [Verrucomicrobiota bacterium]|nr:twin-arginine translocation signal domain-containing protein [Verrucomicrobiota bacterium]
MTYLATKTVLDRRSFLKGSGVAVALPLLHAMTPAFTRAATTSSSPKRFVAMNASLGFHAPYLFPREAGPIEASTPYLKELENHLQDLTLFSGLSHP